MFARTLQRSLPVFSARTFATSARTMSSASIPVPTDFNQVLYSTLEEQDPEVAELIEKETWRQFSGLESVPSFSCSLYLRLRELSLCSVVGLRENRWTDRFPLL